VGDTATLIVPDVPAATVEWTLWTAEPQIYHKASPSPEPPRSGSFPFTVLAPVIARVEPAVAEPGKNVTVTLTSPDELKFSSCLFTLGTVVVECGDGTAEMPVPEDAPPGGKLSLTWKFDYSFEKNEITDTGSGSGSTSVPVKPPPPPPPPPVFDVRPQTSTAAPGLPFVVVFQSLTPGVTMTGCSLTFGAKATCGASGVAVVDIPPDTKAGQTITMPWSIDYLSTRPGEKPGPATGEIEVRVVPVRPDFIVTVQPARARPGSEVTVTLEPVDADVIILDCMAFFPHGLGAVCQRSSGRWFARVVVPPDASPGRTLLRWGVTSLTAGERRASVNGVVPFRVLAPIIVTQPSEKPSDKPSQNPSGKPSQGPADTPTQRQPTTRPPTDVVTQPADTRKPVFVAVTDPEVADPGQPVSVTVQPLTAGTTITGCRAAFDGTDGATCRPAGGTWTARLTVPDDAGPGDLPLLWDVTDTGGAGGGGTINYRVRSAGQPLPAPQVEVSLEPKEVRPGGRVTVTPTVFDEDVTITACDVTYNPGGTMAPCRQTPQGWAADVALPGNAPPGSGTLFWRVAYTRAGESGSTDGDVTVPVLDPEPRSWWSKLWNAAWKIAAGALGLAAAVALAAFQRWRRQRAPKSADDDKGVPAGVAVKLIRPYGAARVTAQDTEAPPRTIIRLTLHRGEPRVRLKERR
jgi:hypothetical protein